MHSSMIEKFLAWIYTFLPNYARTKKKYLQSHLLMQMPTTLVRMQCGRWWNFIIFPTSGMMESSNNYPSQMTESIFHHPWCFKYALGVRKFFPALLMGLYIIKTGKTYKKTKLRRGLTDFLTVLMVTFQPFYSTPKAHYIGQN